ncbi:Uma2 family endonuclease [soil metagenome]
MSVQDKRALATPLTAEQFRELPEIEGKRLELVEGCVIEMAPAGPRHNEIAFYLAVLIYQFVRQHRLGWASGDGTGYIIPGERESVLIPDASFVAADRIPPDGKPETFWPFPPDLAIEVVSPSDRADDVNAKVMIYLRAGTRLVWVVWPRTQTIFAFREGGADTLGPNDLLDGGDVLPGFSVPVAEIFTLGEQPEAVEGRD